MKREIKFRGKRLDGEGWAVGSYIEAELNNGIAHEIVPYKRGEPVVEVAPETVGQFTGLKDKNGRDIYDGDILRITEYENMAICLHLSKEEIEIACLEDCKYQQRDSFIGEVVFSESCFFVGDTYLSAFHGDQRFSQPIFEIEVIGNIHDNPELLKTE